jgi:hypothetical protein
MGLEDHSINLCSAGRMPRTQVHVYILLREDDKGRDVVQRPYRVDVSNANQLRPLVGEVILLKLAHYAQTAMAWNPG